MPEGKPNSAWSVKEMRDYIRSNKLNKGKVLISWNRAKMIEGFKKHGHWSGGVEERFQRELSDLHSSKVSHTEFLTARMSLQADREKQKRETRQFWKSHMR